MSFTRRFIGSRNILYHSHEALDLHTYVHESNESYLYALSTKELQSNENEKNNKDDIFLINNTSINKVKFPYVNRLSCL